MASGREGHIDCTADSPDIVIQGASTLKSAYAPYGNKSITHTPSTGSSHGAVAELISTPATQAAFPHPTLSLPEPELKFDFRISVTLNPLISVGVTPSGQRNWISFSGGTWSGSFGTGVVVPGGQDSQIIHPCLTAELSTNYLLQTNDTPPAYINIRTSGFRTGPPEVLKSLMDPSKASGVDPKKYKFRLFINMETGDERYMEKVNFGMWVGSGTRRGAEVVYDAYRVN